MIRLAKSALSAAILLATLYVGFAVPLGDRTFAQHVDRIGQTPEASELVDGARDRLDPVWGELQDRLLGERVEAPTLATIGAAPGEPAPTPAAEPQPAASAPAPARAARTATGAGSGAAASEPPALPGQRARTRAGIAPVPAPRRP